MHTFSSKLFKYLIKFNILCSPSPAIVVSSNIAIIFPPINFFLLIAFHKPLDIFSINVVPGEIDTLLINEEISFSSLKVSLNSSKYFSSLIALYRRPLDSTSLLLGTGPSKEI